MIGDNVDQDNAEHNDQNEPNIKNDIGDVANAMEVDADDCDSDGTNSWTSSENTWETEEEVDADDFDSDGTNSWTSSENTWETEEELSCDNDDDFMEEASCADNNEIQPFWRPWQ